MLTSRDPKPRGDVYYPPGITITTTYLEEALKLISGIHSVDVPLPGIKPIVMTSMYMMRLDELRALIEYIEAAKQVLIESKLN